jgi:hypothetical protein
VIVGIVLRFCVVTRHHIAFGQSRGCDKNSFADLCKRCRITGFDVEESGRTATAMQIAAANPHFLLHEISG